jgi:hypothetical protein
MDSYYAIVLMAKRIFSGYAVKADVGLHLASNMPDATGNWCGKVVYILRRSINVSDGI